ncbi:MAG: glucose-1-phosphate thymidylyltransferase RfbA [Candidatus Heimdallarchaeota archaeon]|nr:glucose-1-phosphate thymidylyltransferase RfbA [Candidatus Heimdallarchaeota archaeon]
MKGIILAGGSGSRLYPLTAAISKQILPVYDKPMIYYPISILLLANIREILIISTTDHIKLFEKLLGDGSNLGISFEYAVQEKPRGLADAFIIGEQFIGKDNVTLILGDNIFYGSNISKFLITARNIIASKGGALVFGYYVRNPKPFGVIEFDSGENVISIEEKPENPKSNYIVPGLYMYDNNVVNIAKEVKPSKRGEIEITSINNIYLQRNKLNANKFGRGIAWFDAGTSSGLLEASNFIEAIQKQQGFYIACLEEIAYRKGYISKDDILHYAKNLNSEYGIYITEIINEIENQRNQ